MSLASLIHGLVTVTENAAIACSEMVGKGDKVAADKLATEHMRTTLNALPLSGRIVIGEGERDKAPMLFIGEELGKGGMEVDIAVDPLEGTNMAAVDAPNAITVIAVGPKGTLLHSPDTYMDRIVVGPKVKEKVSLDAPVADNLKIIAKAYGIPVSEVTVCVLDRPRHQKLIADIRKTGGRIRLIGDGDVIVCLMAMLAEETGVHASIGIGAAPEATITACFVKAFGGQFQGRLKPYDIDMKTLQKDVVKRLGEMGVTDLDYLYTQDDLVKGDDLVFVATGVTRGDMLRGVKKTTEYVETESFIIHSRTKKIKKVVTRKLL